MQAGDDRRFLKWLKRRRAQLIEHTLTRDCQVKELQKDREENVIRDDQIWNLWLGY